MPPEEYRELEPSREAREVFNRWITFLDREIEKHQKPVLREELVQDNLHQLMLGAPKGGRLSFQLESELAFNVLQLSFQSRNITLEGEYDPAIDAEQYEKIKSLIYFWQMFDRSPAALNHWLGFRFRAMLGRHIFKSMGNNVRIFPDVRFSFGYNLTIEDDCIIHRGVILDDRKEIILRKGTTIADFAAIYSSAPEAGDKPTQEKSATEVGPGAHLGYHATVMGGQRVEKGATVNGMGAEQGQPEQSRQ